MAGLGQAMLFICAIGGGTIMLAAALVLTGRSFLVIVEDTVGGLNRIRWPEEPTQDWLLRGARFGALLAVWLIPAGLLSRLLARDLLPGQEALRLLVLAVPGLWFYLPVGLLSAMSSESGWALFHPTVAWRLLRLAPQLVAFYLLTGALAVAVAVLWAVTLFAPGGGFLLPITAVVGAAAVFIYARQLGRLGWLVARLGPSRNPAPKKAAAPVPPRPRTVRPARPVRRKRRRPETSDPWAVPAAVETPPSYSPPLRGFPVIDPDADSEPYALASESPSAPVEPPPVRKVRDLDDEDGPIPQPESSPAPVVRPPLPEVSEMELQLYLREPKEPPPRYPLLTGVYTFPFYSDSLKPLVYLALVYLILGVFATMVISFSPGLT